MEFLTGFAIWALGLISANAPSGFRLSLWAGGLAATTSHFTSFLSPNASIHFPGSETFHNLTRRWSAYEQPQFAMVVEVATERDVQQAIKLANSLDLPFLATSGSHGGISTLGRLKHGVQINLRRLNSVEILEDNQTAAIGGGVIVKEVTDALWAAGKQTVTGTCDCTSLLGPALGGGHGWLQGRYGLAADNIVQANVVLADGSLVTASAESHPDLFWALRGAGHNFGIVTSVEYKIYDVPENNIWTVGTYIYTQDKLESLFELQNELGAGGKQPVELITEVHFKNQLDIDPKNAVLLAYLLYEGTEEEAEPYTARFTALGPTVATSVAVEFPQINGLIYQGLDSMACRHGEYRVIRFPVDITEYDITTQRAVFNLFSEAVQRNPGVSHSMFMNEGYSVRAVQDVPAESTAYPDRFNNILVSPLIVYFDSSLEEEIFKVGTAMRSLLVEGTASKKLYAYVNYATGDETIAEMYGHEEWRLSKLRSLKEQYDPDNKFGFYVSVI